MFLFDSHCDTPSQIYRGRDVCLDNPYAHVDFPKMKRGGVGAAFFALYTPAELSQPDAAMYALRMISGVRDAVRRSSDAVRLGFFPSEVPRNQEEGKITLFLGMENAAPFGESLAQLRWFARMGVRYVTLTHNGDNAVADSAAVGRRWGGLSPFGRQAVREMNRLGVMVDLSHASDKAFWDCLEVSETSVIASHSCCRALCGHRRNLTDEMLQALGEKGGYVGINLYPAFLRDDFGKDPEDAALLDEADRVEAAFIRNPSDPEAKAAWDRMQDRLRTIWRPDVGDVVDHIDHAVRLAGIDHVGIGTDFDGITVPPEGLESIADVQKIFEEMRRRGYGENAISQVAGGNLRRIFDDIVSYSL